MADAPATPAAPPPAPAAPPPAPAPVEAKDPATSTTAIATKAPSLTELKAARRAAAPAPKAAEPAPVATETPPAEPAKVPVTIDMDPNALKQFTTLSRELRDAKAKAKELETRVAGFGKFEKAQALAKDGKHYDAAREAGIDVDAALAELLGKNDGAAATATQIDRELLKRLETLEQKDAASEAEKAERKKAEADASVRQDREVAGRFVADNAAKYPFLAKSPKLVAMAFEDFKTAREKLEAESGAKLPNDEQAKLLVDALAVHEEDWAKTLGDKKPAETPQAGLDAAVRGGVRTAPAPVKKRMTFEEIKAERAAARIAARK